MRAEDSAAIGFGVIVAVVVASGIVWFTVFRFLRWIVT